ncbi:E3 ubiquitin-protein ligase rnf168 isoform X2 [Toxotes jaculatrix]|uniref:E3 ubiquitin-protein ligase rnf168 isoform X2 n=1 Tax=Toxotes jaculatrix TaxID=941984 RepID=UPI001B3A93B6|nr:E3 ubiquitin-protein ligase rnf168 isoform X2 [Toxotes jaculatrix]
MAPVSDVEVEGSSVSDGRGRGGGSLSLDDCRCPVCLEILMEPVTLPCTHTFCKGCFLESVDKATLCCPMCRKRVSTWARLHSRNNTLVNQQLWRQIQSCFPLQCERRLTGQEVEDDPGVSVCSPTVSRPGELRQEYEDQITKNSAPLSQESLRPADVTPVRKKKEASAGQIEKFLCPLPSKTNSSDCSSSSSFVANKENILLSQAELQGECAPPKLDYYGAPTDRPEPPDLHTDLHPAFMEDQTHRSHLIGDRPSSTKRKSSELEATEEEEVVIITKRGCRSLPSSSSSLEASEWESELLSRRRQEEEDRRLAVIMQRELDQEERRRATDRRKGSADAYLLRQKQRGRVEAGADTDTAGGHSRKTPKASSSRGHKQTTLTEMFSSLSS